MDNKGKNLDPQLKATYERIMGTAVNPPQASSPTVSAPSGGQPTVKPQAAAGASPAPTVSASKGGDATKIVAGGAKGGLSPVLLAIAIILFLAVYTFVWLFIFKVNLPFLPKFF